MSLHETYNLDRPVYEPNQSIKDRIKSAIEILFPSREAKPNMYVRAIPQNMPIEKGAAYVVDQINSCTSLKHSAAIKNMIRNFQEQHADDHQVKMLVNMLSRYLEYKEFKIIGNL